MRLAVVTGARTLRQVALTCDAGRGCGACHQMIRDMIDQETTPANDNRPGCPAGARWANAAPADGA